MRVIVCGGRKFWDQHVVDSFMDWFHRKWPVDLLAAGEAPGADTCAKRWALKRDVAYHGYHANWRRSKGRSGGILRNIRMLRSVRPDCIIAFPGGDGTTHMVEIGMEQKVPICRVDARGHGEFTAMLPLDMDAPEVSQGRG